MSVQKINDLINIIHTANNSTDNIETKIKTLFKYYKEFDALRDKELKKYRENILDNESVYNMLENILNDCSCFAACKTKKIKRELLLHLLVDFLNFINSLPLKLDEMNNDDIITIKLKHTTRGFFGNYNNFIISEPVGYKCKINVIRDFEKLISISINPVYNFDFLSIINNPYIKEKLTLLIDKFNE
ncbi:hypothetical protein BMW23_0212 [Bodo saltans virus]|uniref:Uncharacterized protein n=1 Tax=Bodo saltans virus TaxID=2024608 RepID=A0A2H4UTK3_9VIRU|nr:hypothetical protein QJ851_gp0207 [Bodo saltans virus]ATZ80270.1 hypothetical protein BMW23_0212 [Bodo saltans virus]